MRLTAILATVIVAGTILGGTAFASPPGGKASGNGKTHSGGTIGFVAQADLSGSIELHSPDGLNVHCKGLSGWSGHVAHRGLDAIFSSNNCEDRDGNPYRVWIDAIDAGEPGTHDRIFVRVWRYDGGVKGEMVWTDRGRVATGNVQVKLA
jgi:hypothetical protein